MLGVAALVALTYVIASRPEPSATIAVSQPNDQHVRNLKLVCFQMFLLVYHKHHKFINQLKVTLTAYHHYMYK